MSNIGRITGVFNTPASGTTVITVDDAFALHVWYSRVTADDTVQADQMFGHGFCEGTTRDCGMTAGEDGVNQNQRDGRSGNWCLITNPAGTTDVVLGTTCVFNAGNVTLDYVTYSANHRIHYEIWYGTDGSAEIVNTGADNSPVNTLTMTTPDMVLGWCLGQQHPASSIHAYQSFGVAVDNAGIDQWVQYTYMGDSDTDSVGSALVDGDFAGQYNVDFAAWQIQITAIGSNGCTWTGTNGDHLIFMFLDLAGDNVHVGTFAKSTTSGPTTQQMPTFGFTPDGYAIATCNFDLQTINTNRIVVNSFGAYDEETGVGHSALSVGTASSNADRASWDSPTEVLAGSVALQASGIQFSGTPDAITDATPSIEWNPNTTGATDDVIIGVYGHEEQATGTLFFQTNTGAVTPSGAIVKDVLKDVTGVLTPSGLIVRDVSKGLAGSVSFAGALIKDTIKLVFAGSLTPSGALTAVTQFFRTFTGSLTPSGTVVKTTIRSFAGAVGFAGALIKDTVKVAFTGSVTPTGALATASMFFRNLAGSLTPSGILGTTKLAFLSISGALAPVGTLVKETQRSIAASLTPVGTLARDIFTSIAGTLAPAGALVRRTLKNVAGALSPSGVLTSIRLFARTISGSLAPIGTLTRDTFKNIAGSVSFSGIIATSQTFAAFIGGALAPAGALVKQTFTSMAGSLTPTGIATGIKTAVIAIGGALAPIGTLTKTTLKNVAGSLSPSGIITRTIAYVRTVVGSLTPIGTLNKRTFTSLAGTLGLSGIITTIVVFTKSIAGSLTPSGTLTKETQKAVAGTLSPSGTITRQTFKLLFASMTPSGDLSTTVIFTQLVEGVLTFIGTVATTFIPGGGAVGRIYRRFLTFVNKSRRRKSDD